MPDITRREIVLFKLNLLWYPIWSTYENKMSDNRKPPSNTVKILICKECRFQILSLTDHLCGGERKDDKWVGCKYDGINISQRPTDSLEVRVYLFDRVEPYEGRSF